MPILTSLLPFVGSALLFQAGDPAPAASRPVRWIPNPDFPIQSVSQCEAWRRNRPVSLGGDHRLELSFDDGRPKIACTTVDDWIRARRQGAYAYTTFDQTMECHFQHAAAWYVQLPLLEPSARTAFPPVKDGLGDRRRELVRNSRLGSSPDRFETDSDGWGFKNDDGRRWEWFRPVGLGDWDGDGWEDLLGMRGHGSSEGSGRFYESVLFARRTSGRLVDISHRLLGPDAAPPEITAARRRWLDSCGWPEGRAIELKGTLTLDDDRILPITMQVKVEDAYLTGSYRYDRIGAPIPIEGAFGVGQSVNIEEFPDGRVQTATFSLEWKREGDRISLSGDWCTHGGSGDADAVLSGELAEATKPADRRTDVGRGTP